MTRARGGALLVVAALAATLFAQADAEVIRTTLGRADIRSEPSLKAPIIRQVTEGTYLILIKEDTNWFQVQLPARGGFRPLGYLQKTGAVRVKPAEAAVALDAMRRPPAAKPPGDTIAIGAEVTPKTIWLKAQATQRFPIADAVTSVAAAAASSSVTGVLGGADAGMNLADVRLPSGVNDATWIWVTRASPSAPALANRRPSFHVSYGEIPGLDSREWAPYVVRLAAAGEWRILTALPGPSLAMNYSRVHWEIRRTIVQDEMASSITGLTDGIVRLSLTAPLTPGDYAVVIRPAFSRRAYAGSQILSNEGQGIAFGAAWVFSVK